MYKRTVLIVVLTLSIIALAIGSAVGFLIATDQLFEFGDLKFYRVICYSIGFWVTLNLIGFLIFSGKIFTGKVQELVFFICAASLISGLLSFILYALFTNNFGVNGVDWVGAIQGVYGWLDIRYYGIFLAVLILFVVFYSTFIDKSILQFSGGKFTDKKLKQVESNLENSRWMTTKEIETQFKPVLYSKLDTVTKDGIPVGAELLRNGRDMRVMFSNPCHSIIIGSTGSGKTTTFVSPMIQLIGATQAGSSMVITDPKGELFSLHSQYLRTRGYDVKVVDLRDTYSSFRWNPLDSIWDKYQEYLDANKNVYLRTDNVLESGLKLAEDQIAFDSISQYYEFDGKAFANKDRLIESIKVFKKKTYDEVYEDLNDLCTVLVPIENDKDPMWEKGARSIVFATLLAMLEDSEDPRLGMTKDKYTFYNMVKILQNSSDEYKELRDYFKGRVKTSKALSLSKQVCDAATQTRSSYMSIVYDKLNLFNDAGICALTSASDIKADGLAHGPTALFLKIPDEKDTRHNLAAIFILNIYKTLIKIASAKESLSLDRNVYFIMDEFGNMPKIEKFDKFITVGRSRKIWFTMIVQSYSQLNNVYGETVADIIKGNCGIKMFIGSNDANTCKEYSELCGNITVMTRSTSSGGEAKNESYSDSTQVRPLIYPSELQRLNHPGDIGHSIIVTFGNFPLKTYFTPSFLVPFYKTGKMDLDGVDRYFDEKKLLYSCASRNQILKEDQIKSMGDKEPPKELKLAPELQGQNVASTAPEAPKPEDAQEDAEKKPRSKKLRKKFNDVKMESMAELKEFLSINPQLTIDDYIEYLKKKSTN